MAKTAISLVEYVIKATGKLINDERSNFFLNTKTCVRMQHFERNWYGWLSIFKSFSTVLSFHSTHSLLDENLFEI